MREQCSQVTLRERLSFITIDLDDVNLVVTLVIEPVGSSSTVKSDEVVRASSSLKPNNYRIAASIVILANPHQCQCVRVPLSSGIFSDFGIIVPVELEVLGRVKALEFVITVVWIPHSTSMISVFLEVQAS